MAEYLIQEETLSDIADAIAEKNSGVTRPLNTTNMAQAIREIPSADDFEIVDMTDAPIIYLYLSGRYEGPYSCRQLYNGEISWFLDEPTFDNFPSISVRYIEIRLSNITPGNIILSNSFDFPLQVARLTEVNTNITADAEFNIPYDYNSNVYYLTLQQPDGVTQPFYSINTNLHLYSTQTGFIKLNWSIDQLKFAKYKNFYIKM